MKIKTNIKAGKCSCAGSPGHVDHPDAPTPGKIGDTGLLGWLHIPWAK